MTRKLSVFFWMGVFLAAASMGRMGDLFAADPPPARTEKRMETTIIHVDKYGVYAPNMIFYWDAGMSKQKVSALTGMAEQLRNKEAVITYSAAPANNKDKRPLLIDIAPYRSEVPPSGDSAPVREPSRAPPIQEEKSPAAPPKAEPKPAGEETALPSPRKEAPPEQPKPVLPGSPLITRAEVANFVRECIDAAQNKDIERSLACYGDQVDYYSKGAVNKEFIRRDKGYYFRNWDKIRSSIDGDIVLIVIDQPDLKIAKFNSRFSVENAKNIVSGRAENIWKIQKVGSELKIVDEKQKIIERDSR